MESASGMGAVRETGVVTACSNSRRCTVSLTVFAEVMQPLWRVERFDDPRRNAADNAVVGELSFDLIISGCVYLFYAVPQRSLLDALDDSPLIQRPPSHHFQSCWAPPPSHFHPASSHPQSLSDTPVPLRSAVRPRQRYVSRHTSGRWAQRARGYRW